MKKTILSILLLFSIVCNATTYYVSPSGNDANDGLSTITPFRNWQKLSDVLVAGDVGYIRGGTYVPTTAMSLYIHCLWQDLIGTSGSPIRIENYPGESPVYDFTGYVTTRVDGTEAVYLLNSEYVYIKGLRITGFAQISTGSGVSRGLIIDNSPNCVLEQIEIDHMGGIGFYIGTGSDNAYVKNCDSHHNADPYSPGAEYGGSDGFTSAASDVTNIIYDGCRSWWNSDDGWDMFNTDGINILRNCWSFWNGYIPGTFDTGGDGTGYKLGPTATSRLTDTLRWLYNCLAFENRGSGFNQNVARCLYTLYNNTSYNNEQYGYWWGWENATVQNFKNNCAYANVTADLEDAGSNIPAPYNSWNGTITVSDADFISVSSTGMDGPRNSDGSLPYLPFMQLQTGSDLINAGNNVGLPFNNSAPDVNCFEYRRVNGRIF